MTWQEVRDWVVDQRRSRQELLDLATALRTVGMIIIPARATTTEIRDMLIDFIDQHTLTDAAPVVTPVPAVVRPIPAAGRLARGPRRIRQTIVQPVPNNQPLLIALIAIAILILLVLILAVMVLNNLDRDNDGLSNAPVLLPDTGSNQELQMNNAVVAWHGRQALCPQGGGYEYLVEYPQRYSGPIDWQTTIGGCTDYFGNDSLKGVLINGDWYDAQQSFPKASWLNIPNKEVAENSNGSGNVWSLVPGQLPNQVIWLLNYGQRETFTFYDNNGNQIGINVISWSTTPTMEAGVK